MAVLSRTSLRSSVRKDADPGLHVTETFHQPSKSRPGKRTRYSSPDPLTDTSSKKLKTKATIDTPRNPTVKRDALKALPFRSRQPVIPNGVTPDVKTRKLDPVLVQPKNGIIVSSQDDDESLHHGINQNIPPPAVDTRSLRSHAGGSRSRSELEPYFSNYDDLISINPKELGMYNAIDHMVHAEGSQSTSLPRLYSTSTTNLPHTILIMQTFKSEAVQKGRIRYNQCHMAIGREQHQ